MPSRKRSNRSRRRKSGRSKRGKRSGRSRRRRRTGSKRRRRTGSKRRRRTGSKRRRRSGRSRRRRRTGSKRRTKRRKTKRRRSKRKSRGCGRGRMRSPQTGRCIKRGGATYKKLQDEGLLTKYGGLTAKGKTLAATFIKISEKSDKDKCLKYLKEEGFKCSVGQCNLKENTLKMRRHAMELINKGDFKGYKKFKSCVERYLLLSMKAYGVSSPVTSAKVLMSDIEASIPKGIVSRQIESMGGKGSFMKKTGATPSIVSGVVPKPPPSTGAKSPKELLAEAAAAAKVAEAAADKLEEEEEEFDLGGIEAMPARDRKLVGEEGCDECLRYIKFILKGYNMSVSDLQTSSGYKKVFDAVKKDKEIEASSKKKILRCLNLYQTGVCKSLIQSAEVAFDLVDIEAMPARDRKLVGEEGCDECLRYIKFILKGYNMSVSDLQTSSGYKKVFDAVKKDKEIEASSKKKILRCLNLYQTGVCKSLIQSAEVAFNLVDIEAMPSSSRAGVSKKDCDDCVRIIKQVLAKFGYTVGELEDKKVYNDVFERIRARPDTKKSKMALKCLGIYRSGKCDYNTLKSAAKEAAEQMV